ncbi:MAG: hypothetical protein RLN99_03730 [Kiloniellaceae bacterium]
MENPLSLPAVSRGGGVAAQAASRSAAETAARPGLNRIPNMREPKRIMIRIVRDFQAAVIMKTL